MLQRGTKCPLTISKRNQSLILDKLFHGFVVQCLQPDIAKENCETADLILRPHLCPKRTAIGQDPVAPSDVDDSFFVFNEAHRMLGPFRTWELGLKHYRDFLLGAVRDHYRFSNKAPAASLHLPKIRLCCKAP